MWCRAVPMEYPYPALMSNDFYPLLFRAGII